MLCGVARSSVVPLRLFLSCCGVARPLFISHSMLAISIGLFPKYSCSDSFAWHFGCTWWWGLSFLNVCDLLRLKSTINVIVHFQELFIPWCRLISWEYSWGITLTIPSRAHRLGQYFEKSVGRTNPIFAIFSYVAKYVYINQILFSHSVTFNCQAGAIPA